MSRKFYKDFETRQNKVEETLLSQKRHIYYAHSEKELVQPFYFFPKHAMIFHE